MNNWEFYMNFFKLMTIFAKNSILHVSRCPGCLCLLISFYHNWKLSNNCLQWHKTFWKVYNLLKMIKLILKNLGWKLKKIIRLELLKTKIWTRHWHKQGELPIIRWFVSYVILNVILVLTAVKKMESLHKNEVFH